MLACLLWSGRAAAEGELLDSPVEIHGFASQGYIYSAENEYLARSKKGSFEFSEVGLNVTKQLGEDLRTGVQLFAHDLGPTGNYQPQFDWFYLDYRFRDWLGFRAGRIKVPFGMYNEINDIDAARAPVLLPQSIYPVDHREFLLAQTGGEFYGNVPLTGIGSLEYRLYGGTLFLPPAESTTPGITVSDFNVAYIAGGRALWQTPLDGLHIAFSLQRLRMDIKYVLSPELLGLFQALTLIPPTVTNPLDVKFIVTRWVGSVAYSANDLDLTVEYSRWLGEFESPAPALFPPHTLNERYYAMASYRVNSWFTPSVYYSALYPNVLQRHGHGQYQHDLAFSSRYDLTANWLLKLEAHYMRGTAALDNESLNGGQKPNELAPNWGVFLLKTTAYF